MKTPLAYLLTWTTYGTWLPGDARGWVHHGEGGPHVPYRAPDAARQQRARSRMKGDPVRLNAARRQIVEASIRESYRLRGWPVHALTVRSNHVHLVVTAGDRRPEFVMTHLKAWASRWLNERTAGPRPLRWWTRHGSTRYINFEAGPARAIRYVSSHGP